MRILLVVIHIFLPSIILAQHKFHMEVLPGAAYVLPSALTIQQEGYPDIRFRAKYDVRSFNSPVYYSIRTGFAINQTTALELELNHLKLYLNNNPSEIQRFSISHGYNQLWFNLRKDYTFFDTRLGLGPVIAHPENTIREMKLNETGGLFNNGYYIHGISSQVALQKRFFIDKHFYLNAEAKLNTSYARTNVVNGNAQVWVFAIHGLLGIGFKQ